MIVGHSSMRFQGTKAHLQPLDFLGASAASIGSHQDPFNFKKSGVRCKKASIRHCSLPHHAVKGAVSSERRTGVVKALTQP